ncbi:argonaute binding protein 2 [Schizosaccharomyces octosporus yFS286]|uniref:Argonaute binding protein 2 n=1 Tax=Schizosaccharomyces octosporus (strain yFS286) TaxID=483514 RepID=S9PT49_SCHOY|nr:argonaute binding protein 2 [Schizosaccharomyces octosporus yFS286]EPX70663.1 argonaute binding protein 2 [Schizosaccharomyces octosporus yFS286]
MFRKKKVDSVPKLYNLGNSLKDLGLQITADRRLRKLFSADELYEFSITKDKAYNEHYYQAVLEQIYNWTLTVCMLEAIPMSTDVYKTDEPYVLFYTTKNWKENKKGMVIIIQPFSYPLIWSNRNIREHDLGDATFVNTVSKCVDNGYAVAIFTPSALLWDADKKVPRTISSFTSTGKHITKKNYIPSIKSPEDYVTKGIDYILSECQASKIYYIGAEYGSQLLNTYLDTNWERLSSRTAFVILLQNITSMFELSNKSFIEFLLKVCIFI